MVEIKFLQLRKFVRWYFLVYFCDTTFINYRITKNERKFPAKILYNLWFVDTWRAISFVFTRRQYQFRIIIVRYVFMMQYMPWLAHNFCIIMDAWRSKARWEAHFLILPLSLDIYYFFNFCVFSASQFYALSHFIYVWWNISFSLEFEAYFFRLISAAVISEVGELASEPAGISVTWNYPNSTSFSRLGTFLPQTFSHHLSSYY